MYTRYVLQKRKIEVSWDQIRIQIAYSRVWGAPFRSAGRKGRKRAGLPGACSSLATGPAKGVAARQSSPL